MSNSEQLIQSVLDEIAACLKLTDLENIRVKYLGKTGLITEELKNLSKLSIEEKKIQGKALNNIKLKIIESIETKKEELETHQLDIKLSKEFVDCTLPIRNNSLSEAKIHPITQTINEIVSILGEMGLRYEEGPDVEDDFNNFTALNIPKNHPARQMHDTFYLKKNYGGEKLVLRTHTSPVQIRTLQKSNLPIKIFAPGRTYRCDSDMTHTPMFHQVEGLVVDKNIKFSNLKWFVEEFCKTFFKQDELKLRFRPSYFPFTEPSAEVDINCEVKSGKITLGKGTKWLEILGCGMVHPNVFKYCKLNNDNFTGFAFGMGIERLAMLKYGMPDLRDFFEGDISWLQHYGFSPFDTSDLSWR
ncbi:MAG: phenylalanine--tRNA ligase subunit alpha [Alphaproteobacteria bacterium]